MQIVQFITQLTQKTMNVTSLKRQKSNVYMKQQVSLEVYLVKVKGSRQTRIPPMRVEDVVI